MGGVEKHLIAGLETHVATSWVQAGLARVLALLQQGAHLPRDVVHEPRQGVAAPDCSRGSSIVRRGQGAARVLAAVGVEGRESRAQGGSRVIDGKLHQGDQVGLVILPVVD